MPVDAVTHPSGTALRVSDAEREAAVARLHHALGEGRLDLAETEERVAAAYAATHRSDLVPLLADLPTDPPPGAGTAPTGSTVWTSAVWWMRGLLLGPGASADPPDARARRLAATILVVAAVWMLLCAFLGAALVAA